MEQTSKPTQPKRGPGRPPGSSKGRARDHREETQPIGVALEPPPATCRVCGGPLGREWRSIDGIDVTVPGHTPVRLKTRGLLCLECVNAAMTNGIKVVVSRQAGER